MTTEHAITQALEIIGDAAKNVPESLKSEHPEVPWREMASLRDRIVHKYFQIDYSIVWRVIHEDSLKLNLKFGLFTQRLSLNPPSSAHFPDAIIDAWSDTVPPLLKESIAFLAAVTVVTSMEKEVLIFGIFVSVGVMLHSGIPGLLCSISDRNLQGFLGRKAGSSKIGFIGYLPSDLPKIHTIHSSFPHER